MKKQLTIRLEDLKTEYQKGQERLTALEQETASVRTSMLRISGAIQVLEEILNEKSAKRETDNSEIVANRVEK